MFLLQIFVISLSSIQVIFCYWLTSTKQTEYYVRNWLLVYLFVLFDKAYEEIFYNRCQIKALTLGESLRWDINIWINSYLHNTFCFLFCESKLNAFLFGLRTNVTTSGIVGQKVFYCCL